jgi:CRP/FNR family transcriptional regulator, cyclic AMP receptor protein
MMISPELLRRYPFYGLLTDAQLKSIAMIAQEINIPSGTQIFKEGDQADTLYLLLQGSVDLYYTVDMEGILDFNKEFLVGEINPGDAFGISALMEPYTYTATAKADQNVRVITMDAVAMRSLLDENPKMACVIMYQVAKAYAERLRSTRIQLAAARA